MQCNAIMRAAFISLQGSSSLKNEQAKRKDPHLFKFLEKKPSCLQGHICKKALICRKTTTW